ncbi:MAG TPA: hypothetical protein VMT37_16475 [Solirubrobacterales bacterium]|nr:hypothetical protein [Solirubrobacterales bacterium]
MAQILVLTDAPGHDPQMIHSEHLDPVHLESTHSAAQLIERVTWAVRDAEQAERRARMKVVRRERRSERPKVTAA